METQNNTPNEKWNLDNLAQKANDFLQEFKEKNLQPDKNEWFERVKNNISDTWEDVKDSAQNVWDKAQEEVSSTIDNIRDAEDKKTDTTF